MATTPRRPVNPLDAAEALFANQPRRQRRHLSSDPQFQSRPRPSRSRSTGMSLAFFQEDGPGCRNASTRPFERQWRRQR